MPLVMRTAIAVDINLATFQKIDLFKARQNDEHTNMEFPLKHLSL